MGGEKLEQANELWPPPRVPSKRGCPTNEGGGHTTTATDDGKTKGEQNTIHRKMGSAGTLAGGYLRSAPLPRVTRTARAAHVTHDVASVRSDTVHAALHVALSSATRMLAAVRATSLVPSNHGLLRAS